MTQPWGTRTSLLNTDAIAGNRELGVRTSERLSAYEDSKLAGGFSEKSTVWLDIPAPMLIKY